MHACSVPEAAKRLGVSEQRVRAMIHSGRIRASRIGHRWLVESDLEGLPRAQAGRPLEAANAWALLALLSGDSPEWIHPSVRSRLRKRMGQLNWLESALAGSQPRARIHRWRVLPGDIDKLDGAFRLVRSGLSADYPHLDVVPDSRQVDAYVEESSLGEIERRFRPERRSSDPNLLLRVPSHDWILRRKGQAPAGVVAADLLRSDDPRVAGAARRLLRRLAHD